VIIKCFATKKAKTFSLGFLNKETINYFVTTIFLAGLLPT